MGLFERKGNKINKAITAIEQLLDDADKSLKIGELDKAASEYRRAHRYLYREENKAENSDEYSNLFTRTGHGLFETGEPDRAVECFDKATQLNPNNTDAWMSRGIVHVETGAMLKYAIMCFNEVLKHEPNNIEALEKLREISPDHILLKSHPVANFFINEEDCIGCGICVKQSPDGYELNGEMKAVVKNLGAPGMKEAADACPVGAINYHFLKEEERALKEQITKTEQARLATLESLKTAVTLIVPEFLDPGTFYEIQLTLRNKTDREIKDISIDFSDLEEFFTLEGEVDITTLRRGMELKKAVRIRPRHEEGVFPVKIAIRGDGETVIREYKIKVGGTEIY